MTYYGTYFLIFKEPFHSHGKIIFPMYLILQAVSNLSFCGSVKTSDLFTNIFNFSERNINFVNQLFTSSGDLKIGVS